MASGRGLSARVIKQRISQCMKRHITVGMGDKAFVKGNGNTADNERVVGAESVNIKTMADSYHFVFLIK